MPQLLDRRRSPRVVFIVLLAFALGPYLQSAFAGEGDEGYGNERKETTIQHDGWSEEVLDTAARIPVQQGGRLKPLLTYARFTLLRMHGYGVYRKDKGTDDERLIGPMEWLLDVLFVPEVAMHYECFRVQDAGALIDVGLEKLTKGKKKSDRYTFAQLFPAAQTIVNKAREYEKVEPRHQTGVQRQVLLMARNVDEFYRLMRFMDFARMKLDLSSSPELQRIFDGKAELRASDLLLGSEALLGRFQKLTAGSSGSGELTGEAKAIRDLLGEAEGPVSRASALRIIPPAGAHAKDEGWYSPASMSSLAPTPPEMANLLVPLERAFDARLDGAAFQTAIQDFQAQSKKLAEARDEYDKIPLEVTLFDLSPFSWALWIWVGAFIVVALSWMWPGARWLAWGAMGLLVVGLAFATYGITLRCLIREKPPVSNLYETVVFITAVAVLSSVITEWINKQRIALALAPVVGALGLFIAGQYETLDAKDTMTPLVAVLRSNFWLTTHVLTISIGYCAGLLAGLLGCVYVLSRAFDFKTKDTRYYTSLTRMTYGMLAFGLLFSLVGTILGGIWANDSWGRFWGWDPKENGALMIVLWSLVIVHGRLGGYFKAFGVAMSSIVLGIIVSFSWWGVNLLGVGLHSYGFTQGVYSGLMTFILSQCAVLVTGFFWHFFVRKEPTRLAT
ncbi:MAG: cytochrome c biogenesis protein CcsA [Planctomycetota bacterium]|nr:cytochrome c biogenesis protein CcsA [Planctomycetota bacterium]